MNKAGVELHFVPSIFFSIAENGLFNIKHEEGRDYFSSLMKNVDYPRKPIKIFTKNMKNEFVYINDYNRFEFFFCSVQIRFV